MVLNILGTRVMLPTEPDYDISLLPHFVKEACGTRGFRGCVPFATQPPGQPVFCFDACSLALASGGALVWVRFGLVRSGLG